MQVSQGKEVDSAVQKEAASQLSTLQALLKKLAADAGSKAVQGEVPVALYTHVKGPVLWVR